MSISLPIGCAAPPPTETVTKASISAADIVGKNGDAEQSLHLVARRLVNDNTEVFEVYEPEPGVLLVSAAGHPKGPSMLSRAALADKSVDQIWHALAPDEELPQPLVAALVRQGERAAPVDTTLASTAASGAVSSPRPAPETAKGKEAPLVLNTGYCDTQWYKDFQPGNVSCPSLSSNVCCNCGPLHNTIYSDITAQASGWASNALQADVNVCSSQGVAGLNVNGSYTGSWFIPEDTYRRVSVVEGYTCFLFSCLKESRVNLNAAAQSAGLYNFFFDWA
jgi:hypothetical protein